MSDLLELASRVEVLDGPDREVDADIALTQGWTEHSGDNWIGPEAQIVVPSYTASIDAAMTLVPDDCFWTVGHDGGGADPADFAARVFDPMTMKAPIVSIAATPALALCAAALGARDNL